MLTSPNMNSNLKTLISALGIDANRASIGVFDLEYVAHYFDVSPQDFLEQAEEDFETGGNASLLNSITNAKRAIRSQIDEALLFLGFDPDKMRIQRKMEVLREVGIIAPRILRKVDDARNLLEHEYKAPTIQEVEDALDIASLFVAAISRSLVSNDLTIGNENESVETIPYGGRDFLNALRFRFDGEHEGISVSGYRLVQNSGLQYDGVVAIVGEVIVENADPMYIPILRLMVAVGGDSESKTSKAISGFFKVLGLTF
jgi:hypothetical protein